MCMGTVKKEKTPIQPKSVLIQTKEKWPERVRNQLHNTDITNQNCATEALKQHLASLGQYATHSARNQVPLDSNLNFLRVGPKSHPSLFPKRVFKKRYFIPISDVERLVLLGSVSQRILKAFKSNKKFHAM